MGINFNFGLGGKKDGDDNGSAGAADPATSVATDPNAGTTPPPTEPIMVTPPVATPNQEGAPATEFGDDITINVTDAPSNVEPTPVVGEPQMTEMAAVPTPVAAEPVPLNPFADNTAAPAAEVAPVVAENPFATTAAPTPVVAEPVVLEANQATPVAAPVTPAPLNPFAEEAEAVLPTPTTNENPFASDIQVNETDAASAPVEPENQAAANPFATTAPAEVVAAPVVAEPIAETTPPAPTPLVEEPVAMNPFASDIQVNDPDAAPATEAPAESAPVVAGNPFASNDDKTADAAATPAAAETAPVVESVKEEAVAVNENPFADMSFGEEKPEAKTAEEKSEPAVAFGFDTETKAEEKAEPEVKVDEPVKEDVVEKAEEKKPEPKTKASSTKGDGSSPLSSLENIKAEIASFVATHNQNVEDYKAEIKALEAKINGEKNLLKKRKQEFKNMLGEIEALTEDFTPHSDNSNSEENNNQNNKPKRKRNRNKKQNQGADSHQNQEAQDA